MHWARFLPRIAVFPGPTFAREIAHGSLPRCHFLTTKRSRFRFKGIQHSSFRLHQQRSCRRGVGASLKNVIAIAAGICQGLDWGATQERPSSREVWPKSPG